MRPGFFDVGQLYKGGLGLNGEVVWTQPGGEGTTVFPQFPTQYPQVPQGYPQTPFCYQGLFSFGCGHWANTCEVFQEFDPYTNVVAAFCCCPMCSYIQIIVEPASQWYEQWYTLYNTGLVTGVRPTN
jgi:hypothetical protein